MLHRPRPTDQAGLHEFIITLWLFSQNGTISRKIIICSDDEPMKINKRVICAQKMWVHIIKNLKCLFNLDLWLYIYAGIHVFFFIFVFVFCFLFCFFGYFFAVESHFLMGIIKVSTWYTFKVPDLCSCAWMSLGIDHWDNGSISYHLNKPDPKF